MPYSREQKIEYNKKYRQKMTEEQKEAKRLADREYYHKIKKNVMNVICVIMKITKNE